MTEHLDFSLSLHHQLASPADRSFCWSPYSVASALGLAATATGGGTRRELVELLRVHDAGPDELAGLLDLLGSAAELTGAGHEEGPVLAVANTLWAHERLPLADSYLESLSSWPGNAVRNAPFRADPERARQEINADVAKTTRDLIPELLPSGTVDEDTVAALVNALYLKVSWTEAFGEQQTEQQPFHAPDGAREVPTMHAERRMGYAAQDGWQAVSLAAAGGVEAVVLLPDGDLGPAEAELDAARLEALLSALGPKQVRLALPRFEVRASAELQGTLAALGVHTLFTPAADFTPLTTEPLRVSSVIHESVLRVDEAGLEGAAATAVMMRLTSVVTDEPVPVSVDRPFLFLVRHRASGALYFIARITDPS